MNALLLSAAVALTAADPPAKPNVVILADDSA